MLDAIWMLHRVLPPDLLDRPNAYRERGTLISTIHLEALLVEAQAAGKRFYTLSHWYRRYRSGEATDRDLVLTFDDGYRDNYDYARPLLRRYRIPATFFPILRYCQDAATRCPLDRYYALADAVISDPIQRADWIGGHQKQRLLRLHPDDQAHWVEELYRQYTPERAIDLPAYMTFAQLRVLLEEGHEIGGHSWTHPLLPTLSESALQAELRQTRLGLDTLGVPAEGRSFAYPDGRYSAGVIAALRTEGYACACTVAAAPTAAVTAYTLPRRFIAPADR